MNDTGLINVVILPIVFGLVGFVEPCSIGSTLLMLKQLEGRAARERLVQVLIFAATRGLLIGLLGLMAAAVGSAFLGLQRGAWLLLGFLYLTLGLLYLSGRAGLLMRSFGPSLQRLRSRRGAAALGLVFGLNNPACAAPLILALLGLAAAGGASAGQLGAGFFVTGTLRPGAVAAARPGTAVCAGASRAGPARSIVQPHATLDRCSVHRARPVGDLVRNRPVDGGMIGATAGRHALSEYKAAR